MNTFLTFEVVFITIALGLILGPLAISLAPKLKLLDVPNSAPHKVHSQPVPLVGGIILFITISIVSVSLGNVHEQPILAILASACIIFVFGIRDDYKSLSPLWKILGQSLATLVLIVLGVQVRLFEANWINLVITFVWMVGIANAYNFVDSMDGLAVGLAGLASALFMLITLESLQPQLSLFSTVLLGASLAVYYYNAPPARIFLGDSGAQLLGFLLGALAIAYNPIGYLRLSSWYVPILLMGVPIFDTTLVVVSRLRRKKPVYQAGRDHTYHRLVSLGMSSNRAVLTMQMTALMLGSLAFIALDLAPWMGNLIFGIILLCGILGILFLERRFRKTLPQS